MTVCAVCQGLAYVAAPGTSAPAFDACPRCAVLAEAELSWVNVTRETSEMRRMEHAPAGDAGTVTMGAVRVGAQLMVEVVVHAAVLRTLPWYRGGTGVTTLLLPFGGGRLDIERAGPDAPYRLRARMDQPLLKLPPVQLRVPALPDMTEEERPPEPVAFSTFGTVLTLSLPAWARRMPQRQLAEAGGGA